MPNYWIVKTEPSTYSYDDLARQKTAVLGWGQEQPCPEVPAANEARRPGAGLSHGRREGRRGRGGGDIGGLSGPQAERSQAGRGGSPGSGETAAGGAARR